MPTISQERYDELLEKERQFDKYLADRRKGAAKINNISPEERKARARKAAAARWAKSSSTYIV